MSFNIRKALCAISFVFTCVTCLSLHADEATEALAALEEHLLTLHQGAIMPKAERELRLLMSEEKQLGKKLDVAQKGWQAAQLEQQKRQLHKKELQRQHRNVNAQVASAKTARDNNRLVSIINEIDHQIRELDGDQEFTQAIESARKEFVNAREAYVECILKARMAADAAQTSWRTLESSDKAKQLVADYAAATGKKISLAPSKAFASLVRSLEKLEQRVLTDSIALREGGGTFEVDAVLNGETTVSMVVDSGASLVCLSDRVARESGIQADPDAEVLTLQIADGSIVQARRVRIPSLRVGRFTQENVDAAILPPELTAAPLLLGMSYLGQYDFRLDSSEKTLTMTEVASSKAAAPSKRTRRESPRRKEPRPTSDEPDLDMKSQ